MKNNKKKYLFYLINFVIVLLVSFLTIYKLIKENGLETFTHLKELSVLSIVMLTSIFIVSYYLEGLIMAIAIKEYKKDFIPEQGFVIQCVGGLFSAITPLKLGYFPSLGYAYSKFNVKVEQLLKSMAKTSFTYQVLALMLSFVSVVFCFNKEMVFKLGNVSLDLKYVALIGLMYNVALIIGYFILVLCPQLHNFILKIVAWFLYKIRKIDDKEQYFKIQEEKMHLLRIQIKKYFNNKKEILLIFFIYLLKITIVGSLPYIAYLMISKTSFRIDLWVCTIILGNLITYITSLIPIPGASGAAEIVFIAVFSLIYRPESVLASVMLIWRMFSYFINIIVGFVVFVIMLNIKRKRT